ncbi:MAG TPA: DUF4239 domain-containing protein [Candidatus Eisenbacteria bacterium]|nr:DUF4239 domain-containing protein [Candidatus Eisenbacteria bacterium]
MNHAVIVFLLALGLLLGMLLLLQVGRHLGRKRALKEADGDAAGIGAVDGAIFGLLGLLIAFTFSGASARFDARRELIVEETNDIGTAYLRLDLLPADSQPVLRDLFRRYLDARIEMYRKLPDVAAAKEHFLRANELQTRIWGEAVTASRAKDAAPAAAILLLPALNAMIDITTTRYMATQMHPPVVVFAMLFALALAASLMAGYGMVGDTLRTRVHMLGFALVVAMAVYVILDIEYPRLGLIRVDAFDQALIDLRESMNHDLPAAGPN